MAVVTEDFRFFYETARRLKIENAKSSAYVFKTMHTKSGGKLSFARVLTGEIPDSATVVGRNVFVGNGVGTGPKDSTTIAFSTRQAHTAHRSAPQLLGAEWLARWNRSAQVDEKTPLLRFGLAPLPTTAQVVSVSLAVYVVERSLPTDLVLQAYGLQRAWSEATATWEQATASTRWVAPGANAPGQDRDYGPTAATPINAVGRWYSVDVTHVLRRWQVNRQTNYGLTLKATAGSENANVEFTMASAQFAVAAQRPKLTIHYWVPAF